MTGTITAIIRRTEEHRGGYGFLRDEHGHGRFFHARNLVGGSATFHTLLEGMSVSFDPIEVPATEKSNGLRALNVKVCDSPTS